MPALVFPSLNHLRTRNELIILVCLCVAAYTLLVTSTKINVREMHANFSYSYLQTREILKNTQEVYMCYSLVCLKFKSSCTIASHSRPTMHYSTDKMYSQQ